MIVSVQKLAGQFIQLSSIRSSPQCLVNVPQFPGRRERERERERERKIKRDRKIEREVTRCAVKRARQVITVCKFLQGKSYLQTCH